MKSDEVEAMLQLHPLGWGVRVQQEHDAGLRGGRWLDGLQRAGPRRKAAPRDNAEVLRQDLVVRHVIICG